MRLGRERLQECLFNRPGGTQKTYPFGELCGPKPQPDVGAMFTINDILPYKWRWEPAFRDALLSWLRELQWEPGLGQVTFVELALDFQAHAGRAMPASPGAELQSIVDDRRRAAHIVTEPVASATSNITSKGGGSGMRGVFASGYVPMQAGRPAVRLPFAVVRPVRRGGPQQAAVLRCPEHDRPACVCCRERRRGVHNCCRLRHHKEKHRQQPRLTGLCAALGGGRSSM